MPPKTKKKISVEIISQIPGLLVPFETVLLKVRGGLFWQASVHTIG